MHVSLKISFFLLLLVNITMVVSGTDSETNGEVNEKATFVGRRISASRGLSSTNQAENQPTENEVNSKERDLRGKRKMGPMSSKLSC
jgi:hypothetical protein